METIFKSSKEFEAALQAVIDNFEEVWDKATSTADIPRAFDFKALHAVSGSCRSYQIRGVNKK